MSSPDADYSAPQVSEYNLDPGGSYISPAPDYNGGSGTLSGSIVA